MNEVQVYFVGMCMWWLTVPGPYVLLPELSTDPNTHLAYIAAAPTAFPSGECPPEFTRNDRGNCVYQLNGKGATGGVRIAVVTDKSAGDFPSNAFCSIPPLQRTSLYVLKPEFTPPLGPANAAWMAASGGTPLSGVFPCTSEPAGNCPRFLRWTVPATSTGKVVLVLDNLRTGAPVFAQLANGAQVVISNSPPDAGVAHTKHANANAAPNTPEPAGPLEAEDWCFFFRMITIPGGPDPHCPGPPPIPPPCPEIAPPPFLHPEKVLFQTVACSNSQYP